MVSDVDHHRHLGADRAHPTFGDGTTLRHGQRVAFAGCATDESAVNAGLGKELRLRRNRLGVEAAVGVQRRKRSGHEPGQCHSLRHANPPSPATTASTSAPSTDCTRQGTAARQICTSGAEHKFSAARRPLRIRYAGAMDNATMASAVGRQAPARTSSTLHTVALDFGAVS